MIDRLAAGASRVRQGDGRGGVRRPRGPRRRARTAADAVDTVARLAAIVLGRGVRGRRASPRSSPARRGSAQARELGAPTPVATVLPGVELVVGALLVAGIGGAARRRSSPSLLLVVFSVAIARQLVDGRHPPCACFGAWSQRPLGEGHLAAQRRPDRRRPRRDPCRGQAVGACRASCEQERRACGPRRATPRSDRSGRRGRRPSRCAAAAGGRARRRRAQPGDPLRRLVVADPRVVEPGRDVERRVVGRRRCCRRASSSSMYDGVRLDARVAPLLPLVGGQRQRRVAHRRDDVDERDLGDGGCGTASGAS